MRGFTNHFVKCVYHQLTLLLALSFLVASVVSAEVIAIDPAGPVGDVVVTETLAPLGAPLTYVSGGDGLIGEANVWPTMPDTPANRATATNNYDHTWMQYDPPIVWMSDTPLTKVFAIPGVDHANPGEYPGEHLEFLIWGSNDVNNGPWEQGTITAIYRDGFDTATTTLGLSDNLTSLWSFQNGPYKFFKATSGDLIENFSSPNEGEIDSLAAPRPEPLAQDHLTCYTIKSKQKVSRKKLGVENQFGSQIITIGKERLLCVPTVKHTVDGKNIDSSTNTVDLPHFKCYDAKGLPVNNKVMLRDQFGEGVAVVTKPKVFCAPAQKKHLD